MVEYFDYRLDFQECMSIISRTMTGGRDSYGNAVGERTKYARNFADFLGNWSSDVDDRFSRMPEDASMHNFIGNASFVLFVEIARVVCGRRKLFLTPHGHLGLGPETMSKGDAVCVLGGATMPHILRKQEGFFELVGDCFIDNLMDGEAVIAMKEEKTHQGPIQTERFLRSKELEQLDIEKLDFEQLDIGFSIEANPKNSTTKSLIQNLPTFRERSEPLQKTRITIR